MGLLKVVMVVVLNLLMVSTLPYLILLMWMRLAS